MLSAIGDSLQLSAIRAQYAGQAWLAAHPNLQFFAVLTMNGLNMYSMALDPAGGMMAGPAGMIDDVQAFAFAAQRAGRSSFAYFRGLDAFGRGTGVMGKVTRRIINHPLGTGAGDFDPIGWDELVNLTIGNDNDRARGHLWARMFGGPGDEAYNIVPLFHAANERMRKAETAIRDVFQNKEVAAVFYRVVPKYGDPNSMLPTTIELEAVAVDAANNILQKIAGWRIKNKP